MSERSLINRVENPRSLFNSILSSAAHTPNAYRKSIAPIGPSAAPPVAPPAAPPVAPPVAPPAAPPVAPSNKNLKEDEELSTEPLPDNINELLSKALIEQDAINESRLDNNILQRYDEEGNPIFTTPEELSKQYLQEYISNLYLTKGYYDEMLEEDEETVKLNKKGNALEYLLNMEMPDYSQITKINDMIKETTKNIDEIINLSEAPKTLSSDKAMPCYKKTVLNKGDSFYSSIFRAAKEQNLLTIIKSNLFRNNLSINIDDEESFISDLRNNIVRYLNEKGLPKNKDGIDIFTVLYNATPEVYQIELLNFPAWLELEFPKKENLIKNPNNELKDRKNFIRVLINNIKTLGTYSCNLEIQIAEILTEIAINIIINPVNDMRLYTQILTNITQNSKNIINLHNTNLVEYEYYSFNISQENFDKLKTHYLFLNKIDISNKEKTGQEIIASRNSSIQLKTEQIRILDESILNWNSIYNVLNYIFNTEKYWYTAWGGTFPEEQTLFLQKVNQLIIQDYPEELLQGKNSLLSKKQIKKINLENITIEGFKDIIYNFFTVLNSPETIEKRTELQIDSSVNNRVYDFILNNLENMQRINREEEEKEIAEETKRKVEEEAKRQNNNNNAYDQYQKGGVIFLPLIAASLVFGAQVYKRKAIDESINKIVAEKTRETEHTLGIVGSANFRLPVKPDYLRYQSEHLLKMIDKDGQSLNSIFKPEFENILKIITSIYIPNILELKNLYTKEIEIYRVVIENKTKELFQQKADILKIINANKEYKDQFIKYTKQLTDSDIKYNELIKYQIDSSGNQYNSSQSGIKGFFSKLFKGGNNRFTRKLKNKKHKVTRYGSNKCRYSFNSRR
jgi:hypothetical protein